MSTSMEHPSSRDEDANTSSVVALITAISLPSIESFGSDSPVLVGLPSFPLPPFPVVMLPSRVSVAREVYDDAVTALAALKCLEDAVSACRAAVIERMMGAAGVEKAATSLDRWQSDVAEVSAVAEVATVLCIPHGAAFHMVDHSTALIREHPRTWEALEAGKLSWRHAGTIVDETETLNHTDGVSPTDIRVFEDALIELAPGTTAGSFTSKARRLRERNHPESLPIKTLEAYRGRAMTMDPGNDGMSWLTLHLPAPAAQGIWTHCTRAARALQGPAEHRTLTQLRVDVATHFLLGQHSVMPSADQLPVRNAGGELVCGDGTGYQDGVVDGIPHNPVTDYFLALEAVRTGEKVSPPPLPSAQILLTVPFLGLLNITNEPAELAGYGPIPESVARELVGEGTSFLRILTDPVTGEVLDLHPDRYMISAALRAVLRAKADTCEFPGCTNPVMDTELDHITAWEHGGQSTSNNLGNHCKKHHLLHHFADDKDKKGRYRVDHSPDRAQIKLRGWKPSTTPNGGVGWTSPAGRYYPPQQNHPQTPAYPEWLKNQINQTLNPPSGDSAVGTNNASPPVGPPNSTPPARSDNSTSPANSPSGIPAAETNNAPPPANSPSGTSPSSSPDANPGPITLNFPSIFERLLIERWNDDAA